MKYIIQTDIDCIACFDDVLMWLLELQNENKLSWLAYILLEDIYIIFIESEISESEIFNNMDWNLWCNHNIYISKAIDKVYNYFYKNAKNVNKNWMF